jgi:HSP20 family protein
MLWNVDPWHELERIRREVDSVFSGRNSTASRSFPLINVYESSDDVAVTAELPGHTKEDISITYSDGMLTLSGDQKPAVDTSSHALIRRERPVGKFEKTIRLPAKIDAEKISAAFYNGILKITMAKAEEAKPRQIAIDVK